MKQKLGDEAKIWKSLGVALPFEVLNKIGAIPGDKVQFFDCGNSVVIEKAE